MIHILCLTDFSSISVSACKYAFQLAIDLNAKITIAHVAKNSKNLQQLFHKLHQISSSIKHELSNNKLNVQVIIGKGNLFSFIEAFSKKTKIHIVVIGTKGKKLFGSNTKGLLSRSMKIPLLVIPPLFEYTKIKKIVYAMDDPTEEYFSKPILKTEVLSRELNAELHFVHVDVALAKKFRDDPESLPELEKEAQMKKEKLTERFKEYIDVDSKYHNLYNEKSVVKCLKKFIHLHNINLLVMVHRKRSGYLDRLIKKSKTRRIYLQSNVPLLVFQE